MVILLLCLTLAWRMMVPGIVLPTHSTTESRNTAHIRMLSMGPVEMDHGRRPSRKARLREAILAHPPVTIRRTHQVL